MKLKIILLLGFLFLLYINYETTEGYSNGRITKNYVIEILSKEEGMKVMGNLKNVNNYNDREISARSKFKVHIKVNENKKSEMKDMYVNNVMNFTKDEKQSITDGVNYLFSKFYKKVPLIGRWKFIKLNNIMDWGYPFTIGDYIVMPSERISMNVEVLARTLFHEQMHIIQRKEPKIFQDFFEKHWNFKKYNLPDDPWINEYLVRNPDSDDFYIYKITDELNLLPLPTTYDKHYRFTESAIFLTNNLKILAKGEEPYIVPLRQVADYVTRFYNVKSLYHPNEIISEILTDMLFNDLSVSEIDHNSLNDLFKMLKQYS